MSKAVFFDRDGVINKVIMRDDKPCSPRSIQEFVFVDGVDEAIRRVKEYGFKVIVITNQPDIARGKMEIETLRLMTERIYKFLNIDQVIVCPHDDHHRCACRKPKPGMLVQAGMDWGIDLKQSFLIGDGWKDMEAGKGAGCTTLLIDMPYNKDVQADFRVDNLLSAIDFILKEGN